jgi:hypothetical protein
MDTGLHSELEAALQALFRRCPALHGFSVETRPPEGELFLANVEFNPWADIEPPERLVGLIAEALTELIEGWPEARHLIGGRTFARTCH